MIAIAEDFGVGRVWLNDGIDKLPQKEEADR
jgi:hypothetical protein